MAPGVPAGPRASPFAGASCTPLSSILLSLRPAAPLPVHQSPLTVHLCRGHGSFHLFLKKLSFDPGFWSAQLFRNTPSPRPIEFGALESSGFSKVGNFD